MSTNTLLDEDMISPYIQKHPEYPDIIDAIEEWGDKPKSILIAVIYDESGESHTKHELRKMSRGLLLAMVIDQIWEGGIT